MTNHHTGQWVYAAETHGGLTGHRTHAGEAGRILATLRRDRYRIHWNSGRTARARATQIYATDDTTR